MTDTSSGTPSGAQENKESARKSREIRPYRPGTRPGYAFCAFVIRLFDRLFNRFEVVHPERIPATGPMLVVPTHSSFFDPPLVGSNLGREVHFLSRDGILKVPIIGPLCIFLNAHSIRRGASDREAIRTCRAVLHAGWPLVFFPEGTRTHDGNLGRIQGGWTMILESLPGVPYLPVMMQDTYKVLPRGSFFPRPRKIRMIIGHPSTLPPREDGESARAYYERCAARLESQWRDLGAQ